MKTQKSIRGAAALFMLFYYTVCFPQGFNVSWSNPILSDNKLDGFFNTFIGSNSSYCYVKYSNMALRPSKQNRKIVIKGLDKATMSEKISKTIVDFSDKDDKEKYAGLEYYKTAVFENVIYVFWKNETKEADELYVRTFDVKLKPVAKLKKIYEMKKEKTSGAKQPEIFVLYNSKAGDNIVIGGEMAAANGQPIKVEYKLMKSDLTFIQARQADLPISKTGRAFDGFSSNYEYGDDGKLFIYSHITPTKEERKALKKEEGGVLTGYYDIMSAIDLNSGQINSFTLKFDKKHIASYKAIIDHNSLRVTGFFCDLTKDPKGNDNHGLFYVMLDDKDLKLVNSKFSYFSAQQLDELFAKDKQDRKDRTGIFTSKKKKQSEEESMSSRYNIEEIKLAPNGELVLFGSSMWNYSRQVCTTSSNGQTTCRTYYYCQKDNVTAFRLAKNGDLLWAKNMDRRKTYSRWDVYDLSVAVKDDKYYVIYGSDFQTKAEKKNNKASKSSKQKIDKLEYAIFDGSNGAVIKNEETINKINAKKDEKKYIDPTNIYVMDNNFYIPSQKTKFKPGRIALDCGMTLLCFPVGYFFWLSPNNYKANGFIGKLSPK